MSADVPPVTQQPSSPSSAAEVQVIENSQRRRVNYWFHLLLAVLLAAGMIWLYYRGFISSVELNRVCLILELVAGLLFAPEVLERTGILGRTIKSLEGYTQRLHNRSQALYSGVSKLYNALSIGSGGTLPSPFICALFAIIVVGGFSVFSYWFISFLLGGLYILGMLALLFDIAISRIKGREVNLGRFLQAFLIFPFGFIILIFLIPIIYLRFHLLRIIVAGTRRLLLILSRDGEIRITLIVWGILLFVMKILFQYVMTIGQ